MKKRLALVGIILLAALAVAGYFVREACRETLKVGVDCTSKPYVYIDETGCVSGLDVDLARAICKELGWKIEFVMMTFNMRDQVLASYAADCIWAGITMTGRESLYEWVGPYTDNKICVMVRKDSSIKTPADLAGKVIGVQSSTTAETIFRPGGKYATLGSKLKNCIPYLDPARAVAHLASKYIDAVVIDEAVAMEFTSEEKSLTILPEWLQKDQFGVAFGKDVPREKLEKFRAGFRKVVENGTAAKISAKYFKGKNVVYFEK